MAETWRVVLASGEVREIVVTHGRGQPPWTAEAPAIFGTSRGVTPWAAVVRLALRWGTRPREILAPGEPTRAELRAQIATLTRVVDALRAAAVVAGHPAADGDPDAQLCAVRAAAWNAGAEAMRQEIVVSLTPREVDIGRPVPVGRVLRHDGGVAMTRYYCGLTGCGVAAAGDRCEECGRIWSAHREIEATWCGCFVGCPDAPQRPDPALAGRTIADHGHHCDLAPGHAGPHHTAGCGGAR